MITLKYDIIEIIKNIFHVEASEICNVSMLKKGMTNRSFIFEIRGDKYIFRVPGEGTNNLINRFNEMNAYKAISGKGFCDDPIYINPENGYKITKYLYNTRTANSRDDNDLFKCMSKLRSLHDANIKVDHSFDLFRMIDSYEKLRNGTPSVYADYQKTKNKVLSLKSYVDRSNKRWTLTHIDAVTDNFLFYNDCGVEKLQLTDWEYAGMQDAHVDIAMFCLYSFYEKHEVDHLIDIYFSGKCDIKTKAKIYCYISIGGLLWSNWCEYKSLLGIELNDYSLHQYQYAKDYYRYATEEIKNDK